MLYVELGHGRPIDPLTGHHPDMNDWGDEGPIFKVDRLLVSYGNFLRMVVGDFDQEFGLTFHEDLIYYDGVGYGDYMVTSDEGLVDLNRVQEFDEEKAQLPEFPKAKETKMQLDIWEHVHNHGSDILTMTRQDLEPVHSRKEVVDEHKIDFEPDRGESLEWVKSVSIPAIANVSLGKNDLANVLFALRFLQSNLADPEVSVHRRASPHFADPETNPYNPDELDTLCERLNT